MSKQIHHPDFGTGQKKLGVYVIGLAACVILTLVSFGVVMFDGFSTWEILLIIYSAAFIQLFVQLVCFIRLNTKTEQGKTNVISITFTGFILATILVGSLWIMYNLDYYMMN